MYLNPKHRKDNETKVRLNEPAERAVQVAASLEGKQKAVWMREQIEARLQELGFDLTEDKVIESKRLG